MKNLFLIAATFTTITYACNEEIKITIKKPSPKNFVGEAVENISYVFVKSNLEPATITNQLRNEYGVPAGKLVITDERNSAKDVSNITSCTLKQLRYHSGTPVNHIIFLSEPAIPYDEYESYMTEGEKTLRDLKSKFGPNAGDPLPSFNLEAPGFRMPEFIEMTPHRILEIPIYLDSASTPTATECTFTDESVTLLDVKNQYEKKYKTNGNIHMISKNDESLIVKNANLYITLNAIGLFNYRLTFFATHN